MSPFRQCGDIRHFHSYGGDIRCPYSNCEVMSGISLHAEVTSDVFIYIANVTPGISIHTEVTSDVPIHPLR